MAMTPGKILSLLALLAGIASWQVPMAAAGIDSPEDRKLVLSAVNIDTLKETAKGVQLTLVRDRNDGRQFLLIRYKTDHEVAATPAEIEAFRAECLNISSQMSAKLQGCILPIPDAEIKITDQTVCHYLWTTYDLLCTMPLRFAEDFGKSP